MKQSRGPDFAKRIMHRELRIEADRAARMHLQGMGCSYWVAAFLGSALIGVLAHELLGDMSYIHHNR
jgi:hypothetical protein